MKPRLGLLPGSSRPVLQIVTYPHPALRYESRPVLRIDDALRSQVRRMFDLMYEARGIGLAANQVAVPARFFVLNLTADPSLKDQEQVFINPEIIKRHASAIEEEGCLSFPGLYAPVPRARRIRVRYYDLEGNERTIDAQELYGRAIQHETDHLLGKLFIDYLTPEALKAATTKLREIESGFRAAQSRGDLPPDESLARALDDLARQHTATQA